MNIPPTPDFIANPVGTVARDMTDLSRILTIIQSRRYRFTNEDELQRGIADTLEKCGVAFRREAILSPGERIDFLLECGVGIEVKIAYPRNMLLRQLQRYAESGHIYSLLVVTPLSRLGHLPTPLHGKPVHGLVLTASAL